MRARVLHGGWWNLDNGRRPLQVAGEVSALLRTGGPGGRPLDFLAVCEAANYADELAALPGYSYLCRRGAGGSERDAGILVRHGLAATRFRVTRTRTRWPRTQGPGLHWPRAFPQVKVEGVRVAVVHMPRNLAANRAATIECWARLAVLLATPGRVVAGPDWNQRPAARGAFTPRSLARVTRTKVAGSRIDHLLHRGVRPEGFRYGPHRGSDHPAVLASLRY